MLHAVSVNNIYDRRSQTSIRFVNNCILILSSNCITFSSNKNQTKFDIFLIISNNQSNLISCERCKYDGWLARGAKSKDLHIYVYFCPLYPDTYFVNKAGSALQGLSSPLSISGNYVRSKDKIVLPLCTSAFSYNISMRSIIL